MKKGEEKKEEKKDQAPTDLLQTTDGSDERDGEVGEHCSRDGG
jgi:hypothetical protein